MPLQTSHLALAAAISGVAAFGLSKATASSGASISHSGALAAAAAASLALIAGARLSQPAARTTLSSGAGSDGAAATAMTKTKFLQIFEDVAAELVEDVSSKFRLSADGKAHIARMLSYTVPGGKMTRGLTVVSTAAEVAGRPLTEAEQRRAAVLGWCVEWLQASFLVADDIMDSSVTRRGQPCWYKNPEIGTIAINDALMLMTQIDVVIERHFAGLPSCEHLHRLMFEVAYKTELGQLLDTTSQPLHGEVDLAVFTMHRYRMIVQYKTAYYSFYLPIATGLALNDVTDPAAYAEAEQICMHLGEYFQVQDDYLDCYGAPEVIGKIGTDIEDSKCSWLVIQALSKASAEQKAVLERYYGKTAPENVERVKALYRELGLEAMYAQFESDMYEMIKAEIAKAVHVPKPIFEGLLAKIHKRSK